MLETPKSFWYSLIIFLLKVKIQKIGQSAGNQQNKKQLKNKQKLRKINRRTKIYNCYPWILCVFNNYTFSLKKKKSIQWNTDNIQG